MLTLFYYYTQSYRILGLHTYSAAQKKGYEYCFMKQKWQIQMGIAQYKDAPLPLSMVSINTTR